MIKMIKVFLSILIIVSPFSAMGYKVDAATDDNEGPTITSIKVGQSDISKNQALDLKIEATDPSGLANQAVAILENPNGEQVELQLHLRENGLYISREEVGHYVGNQTLNLLNFHNQNYGSYKIKELIVRDVYGNRAMISQPLPTYEVFEDTEAPAVQEISFSKPYLVKDGLRDLVSIHLKVKDNGEISSDARVFLKHVKTGQIKEIILYRGSFNEFGNTIYSKDWGDILLGNWIVEKVFLKDVVGNEVNVSNENTQQQLQVLSIQDDVKPPQNVTFDFKDTFKQNSDVVWMNVSALDETFVKQIDVVFEEINSGIQKSFSRNYLDWKAQYDQEAGLNKTYQVSANLAHIGMGNGTWDLKSIKVTDFNNNSSVVMGSGQSVYISARPTMDASVLNGNYSFTTSRNFRNVYVMPGATLQSTANINVYENMYVFGKVKALGGLSVNKNIYGKTLYRTPDVLLEEGDIQALGQVYYQDLIKGYPVQIELPVKLDKGLTDNGRNEIDLVGQTLPFDSVISINDDTFKVDENGYFSLIGYPVPDNRLLTFKMSDRNGHVYEKTMKVWPKDKPIVTNHLPSGIYMGGKHRIKLTDSKEGNIYYAVEPTSVLEQSYLYNKSTDGIELLGDLSINYYSLDELGIRSDIGEGDYRVFNIDQPFTMDTTLKGYASPGLKIEVTIEGKTYYTTVDENNLFSIPEVDLKQVTSLKIRASDSKYVSQEYVIPVKNNMPPNLEGVEPGGRYNKDVTITFDHASVYVNDKPIRSGDIFTEEGDYKVTASNEIGGSSNFTFSIDRTAPEIYGFENDQIYSYDVTVYFYEGSATVNDVPISSFTTFADDGEYIIKLIDDAGNESLKRFSIDKSAPTVRGVENGKIYNSSINIEFDEGLGTLNGELFTSGDRILNEGSYFLTVMDSLGNQSTIQFTIDLTSPTINGVKDNVSYNQAVNITYDEGTAYLNGEVIKGNSIRVSSEGKYLIEVVDEAGNVSKIKFEIDSTPPYPNGVWPLGVYTTSVTPTFDAEISLLNNKPFSSGTTISEDGIYNLTLKDNAGNITSTSFTIDKTPMLINGAANNQIYNQPVQLAFNEGTVFVNGEQIESGYKILKTGEYKVQGYDYAGNITRISFEIDVEPPIIQGVDKRIYNDAVRPIFNEGTALLNDVPFSSNTTVDKEGSYTLVVRDKAGNTTEKEFMIDYSSIAITGVENGKLYNESVTPLFSEGTALLNGKMFKSGTTISEDGFYLLHVKDIAGNDSIYTFTIDLTKPEILGVQENTYTHSLRAFFSEGNALLNNEAYTSGQLIDREGTYVLTLSDEAGNVSSIRFSIDSTPPRIENILNDGVYQSAAPTFEGNGTLNGEPFVSGHEIIKEGKYHLSAKDEAGNESNVSFEIDRSAPMIKGVESKEYNTAVNAIFNEGKAVLNGLPYESGTIISKEGDYVLSVVDIAGNSIEVKFKLDFEAPEIQGIDSKIYNKPITPIFVGVGILNGEPFLSGTVIKDQGQYELTVQDKAGNRTVKTFTIDKSLPIISGVTDKLYNSKVTPEYNEGFATLNGQPFSSGTKIESDGYYELEVIDQAGNVARVEFEIDRTSPTVSGITSTNYSKAVYATFSEGKALLNNLPYLSGSPIEKDGDYTFTLEDLAGNITMVQFRIDRTPDRIFGVESNKNYNHSVTPTFIEGIAYLNGLPFKSGTTISEDGYYFLSLEDKSNNRTSVFFTIDKVSPLIYNVEKPIYNKPVIPIFTEGLATLNGQPLVSGTVIKTDGNYSIKLVDEAGNVTEKRFILDQATPIIEGVSHNKTYDVSVRPIFTEGIGVLNGKPFVSGDIIAEDGNYTLNVKDEAGNETTISFKIDQLPLNVSGISNEGFYNHSVRPVFIKGTARLNGKPVVSGTLIQQEGDYLFELKDDTGKESILKFTIDLTAPVLLNVKDKAYNQEVTPYFFEGTATLNGKNYLSGTPIKVDGEYTLSLQDQSKNVTTVRFSIDTVSPTISGITNGELTNESIVLSWSDGFATLNGKSLAAGTILSADGEYELKVKDNAENETTVHFKIDRQPVSVTGVENGKSYQQVKPIFTEGTAKLNGVAYLSGTSIALEGNHTLIVTDEAGNETKISFTIDYTAPIVNGFIKEKSFYREVTPTFTEGVATLNGKSYITGTKIATDGDYELKVTDKAENETIVRFKIDRKPVIVTGVEEGKTYQQAKSIFTEGIAKLNGLSYTSGTLITLEGNHVLLVTDEAGNETKISFTIDHTAPAIKGFLEGKSVYREVTPTFTEGAATLNGQLFASGTTISSDGDYELKVKDQAGNETTVRFKIDRKPVTVTGVESGKTYQQVKPIFTEGVGKLNGTSYVSGTNIDQTGDYVLIVTDDAGNETKLSFIIDRTSPVISGLVDGKQSYREVTPLFSEGTALLNGKTFASGTKLVQEGKYVLKVTDQIGNVTTREFTIDRTTPIVTGVKSKQLTNKSVTVTFNEGSATINGKNIASGQTVVTSGSYTLRVTDEAGNVTLLTFTIDKVAPSKPSISTLTNKSTNVTGKAENGTTVSISYDGRTYTTKASTAGTYSYSLKTTKAGATVTVRAKDAAGNLSTAASSKVLNTFATFTVNTVKSSATSVTGKGNRAATVQAFVGTKAISKTAKVDSKGNYKLTIPRQKAGVTVTVKMTQTGYQELKKTTKVVK